MDWMEMLILSLNFFWLKYSYVPAFVPGLVHNEVKKY
jgi:hypothetical protein